MSGLKDNLTQLDSRVAGHLILAIPAGNSRDCFLNPLLSGGRGSYAAGSLICTARFFLLRNVQSRFRIKAAFIMTWSTIRVTFTTCRRTTSRCLLTGRITEREIVQFEKHRGTPPHNASQYICRLGCSISSALRHAWCC